MFTKVPAYYKALIFKNGRFIKMIDEGTYWFLPADEVVQYDMSKPFVATVSLNVLLADEALAEALYIADIKINELGFLFENGLFKQVLQPGRYAWWKGVLNYNVVTTSTLNFEISEDIDRSLVARLELTGYVRYYAVESYERGLLFVDGVYNKELPSGIYYFWKNAAVLTVYKVDTRQQQMEMSGQEILTKDKANIRINFAFQYVVNDIFAAAKSKEYEKQLYMLMQLALRSNTAIYTLDELLDKKESISAVVMETVAASALQLGVTVNGCGIRDIILPGDVKDIMNQVLIAEKKAQANVIMRREETSSTRSLLNTAKLMEENEMLYKLKEMEYVEKIADKISNISVSGSGDIVGQLKQIFIPAKSK